MFLCFVNSIKAICLVFNCHSLTKINQCGLQQDFSARGGGVKNFSDLKARHRNWLKVELDILQKYAQYDKQVQCTLNNEMNIEEHLKIRSPCDNRILVVKVNASTMTKQTTYIRRPREIEVLIDPGNQKDDLMCLGTKLVGHN